MKDNYHVHYPALEEWNSPEPLNLAVKLLFDPDDADRPFSAALYRFPPHASGSTHSHDTEIEIYVVMKGKGILEIDGKEYPISPDDLVYVPPQMVHTTYNTGDEEMLLLAIFVPPVDFKKIKENWSRSI